MNNLFVAFIHRIVGGAIAIQGPPTVISDVVQECLRQKQNIGFVFTACVSIPSGDHPRPSAHLYVACQAKPVYVLDFIISENKKYIKVHYVEEREDRPSRACHFSAFIKNTTTTHQLRRPTTRNPFQPFPVDAFKLRLATWRIFFRPRR